MKNITATTLKENTHILNNLSFTSDIELHRNDIPPIHNLNKTSVDLNLLFHNLSLIHSILLFPKIAKPLNNAPNPKLQNLHKKESTTPIRGTLLHNLNNKLIILITTTPRQLKYRASKLNAKRKAEPHTTPRQEKTTLKLAPWQEKTTLKPAAPQKVNTI
ncbi:MAG: hypothetical protein AB2801_18095 [Candidatus Thiodiazotropha endolucinida]